MNQPEPDSADLVEDLTFRCLEAIAAGETGALDELLAAQPQTVRADVRRRLTTLQRVGLAGESSDAATPDRFGPFQLLARIGAGSMGVVYRATRPGSPGELALKLLQPGLLPLHGARLRFDREIAALRDLAHPAICPILDDGEVDGVPYLAMPFVAGESLHDWFARTGVLRGESRERLLAILHQIALALHHAHERGFVHRDVKPANVLVRPDGEAVLLDFGLARLDTGPEQGSRLTVSGAVLGTPAYMAPEQVAGTPLDRRCDVYALGAVLYEGLTGCLPHDAPTRASLYRSILTGDVARPSQRVADLPRDLDVVCLTALDRDPSERYATAHALAEDLQRVRAGESPLARLPGPCRRAWRWVARHPLPSALLFVLASAALGILLLAGRLGRELRHADARALATRARSLVTVDPHAALHLALQAYDAGGDDEAAAAVQAALAAERTAFELQDHRGWIIALQFDVDGQHLLSTEAEGTARYWDLRTQTARALAHGSAIHVASLAPAGKGAATAGEHDGRVCVFDRATGKRLWTRLAHSTGKPITVLCWSPSGERLLTGSADGSAKIWDLAGELLSELPVQPAAVTAGVWLDEQTVATGTGQTQARTAEVEEHSAAVCAWRFAPVPGSVVTAAKLDEFACKASVLKLDVHPTQRELLFVILREPRVARLWRIGDGSVSLPLEGAPSSDIVAGGFFDDGERLFTAAFGGRITIWDLQGRSTTSPATAGNFVRTAIAIPGSRGIVHASDSGLVRVTNEFGVWARTFGERLVRSELLAVAAGGHLLAATSWDGRILVWRLFDPDRPVFSVGAACNAVCWLADGTVVIGGHECGKPHKLHGAEVLGRVLTCSPESGEILDSGPLDHSIFGIDASTDGQRLVVSRASNLQFRLEVLRKEGKGWVADGAPRLAGAKEQGCLSGCFDGSGKLFVACTAEGHVRLWDLQAREVVRVLPDHDVASVPGRAPHRQWLAVTATPDARTIWASGTPGVLYRFDQQDDGSYRETRRPLQTQIRALAALPDGSLLVAGSAGLVRLLADGRQVTFRGHPEAGLAVAWTYLDGQVLVVSSDRQGVLRLWRQDGTFLRELPGHAEGIWSVCFSPDGRRILSGSDDGTARIWWTRKEDLLRAARAALRPLTAAQRAQFGIEPEGR